MHQPYLLPGALPAPRRRTNFAPIFAVVFLAVFFGAGYAIWLKLAPHEAPPPPASPVQPPQSATEPLMEDLDIHFQNAIRSTIRSSELVRESQSRIRSVIPAMDRNYLPIERMRLQAAYALAEKAVRESNRASEELEVAQKLTQEKITEGGNK